MQFQLHEAIKPTSTPFGIDLHDGKWLSMMDRSTIKPRVKNRFKDPNSFMYYTFFECSGRFYQVYIGENQYNKYPTAGFTSSISDEFDYDKIKSKDLEYLETNFTYDKTYGGGASSIFNKFFYVILKGANFFHLNKMCFVAFDENLGKLYNAIVHNQKFLDSVRQLGFEFCGITEQYGEQFYMFDKHVNEHREHTPITFKQFITERTTPEDKLKDIATYINTDGITRLAQCYGELSNRIKTRRIVPVDTDHIVVYYKTHSGDPVHADLIRNGKIMIRPEFARMYGDSCSTLEMTWREFKEKYLKIRN